MPFNASLSFLKVKPGLLQFLTAKNLKILFNSLDPKSGGYRLLMEKAERKLRKMKFDGSRSVEEGPGTRTPVRTNSVYLCS